MKLLIRRNLLSRRHVVLFSFIVTAMWINIHLFPSTLKDLVNRQPKSGAQETNYVKFTAKNTMHPLVELAHSGLNEDIVDFPIEKNITHKESNRVDTSGYTKNVQDQKISTASSTMKTKVPKVISLENVSHSANCTAAIHPDITTSPPPFRIYIYDLPHQFNTDLVDCMQIPHRFEDFNVDHCGFGPEFYSDSGGISIRDTWQFTLDIIIHHKLLFSPYRTLDPDQADVFYIPFYEASHCFCKWEKAVTYNGVMLESALFKVIEAMPYYRRGFPHFMTVAKIEKEETSPACPLLRQTWTNNVTLIGIEKEEASKNADHLNLNRYFIAAPYPSYGHFTTVDGGRYVQTIYDKPRKVFLLLAASNRRTNKFRNTIADQFPNRTSHDIKGYQKRHNVFSNGASMRSLWFFTPENSVLSHKITMEWMKDSIFCAQPPGDSPTRKSLFDAILSGCIPVLFKTDYYKHVTYPFDTILDYSNFTVTVPANSSSDIWSVLGAYEYNVDAVRRLQENLRGVMRFMQYSYPVDNTQHEDAMKLILQELGQTLTKPGV